MKIIKNKRILNIDSALDSIQIAPKALSGGYSLLEFLFYIVFFSILSLVIINAMVTMTKSFRETAIQTELIQSGSIMERISREIRQANSISSIATSDLVLDTGEGNTIEFKLVGSDIQLWDAGSNVGNLNSANITVSNLSFTQITTAQGVAVKVLLTVRSNNDALTRNQDFYDTIALRGSY